MFIKGSNSYNGFGVLHYVRDYGKNLEMASRSSNLRLFGLTIVSTKETYDFF